MGLRKSHQLLFASVVLLFFAGAFTFFAKVDSATALENFRELTEREPLFVSQEYSAEKIEPALDNFEAKQGELVQLLKINRPVTQTKFLRSTLEVSDAQNKFMADPSYENGSKLVDSYRGALGSYREGLQRLRQKIDEVYPAGQDQEFIYAGSSATSEIIRSDLDLMQRNADALELEINNRQKVLDGRKPYHPKSQISTNTYLNAETELPFERLTEKTENLHQQEVFYLKTSCFQPTGTYIPFGYYMEQKPDGSSYLLPKIIGDNYYQRLNKGVAAEEVYLNQGLEWRSLREGNSYRCNNLEYYGTLLSMKSLLEIYRDKPFFETNKDSYRDLSYDEKKLWDEGSSLETEYFQNETHTEATFNKLGEIYQRISISKNIKSESRVRDLIERSNLINNKQADLDLILNSLFSYDDIVARIILGAKGGTAPTERYLYVARSNYSFVFLNFSGAVWRLSEKPNYLGAFVDKGAYTNLKAIKNKYSPEQIRAFEGISEKDILSGY